MAKTKLKSKSSIKIDSAELEKQWQEENGGVPIKKGIRDHIGNLRILYKRFDDTGIPKIMISGAKVTGKIILWVLKQFFSLVGEGIKGTMSGVAEAGSASRTKSKSRSGTRTVSAGGSRVSYVDNRQTTIIMPPKEKKRPIWEIPTKEEEELERLGVL